LRSSGNRFTDAANFCRRVGKHWILGGENGGVKACQRERHAITATGVIQVETSLAAPANLNRWSTPQGATASVDGGEILAIRHAGAWAVSGLVGVRRNLSEQP
jgi:hypothetical protein